MTREPGGAPFAEEIRALLLRADLPPRGAMAEALLFRSGAINRMGRVEDKSTTTDFDPEEQEKGFSLALALAPIEWNGHKINIIDTPGYADFEFEAQAALRRLRGARRLRLRARPHQGAVTCARRGRSAGRGTGAAAYNARDRRSRRCRSSKISPNASSGCCCGTKNCAERTRCSSRSLRW